LIRKKGKGKRVMMWRVWLGNRLRNAEHWEFVPAVVVFKFRWYLLAGYGAVLTASIVQGVASGSFGGARAVLGLGFALMAGGLFLFGSGLAFELWCEAVRCRRGEAADEGWIFTFEELLSRRFDFEKWCSRWPRS
jgi:hypothetical protein